jgi:ribonuclease HI
LTIVLTIWEYEALLLGLQRARKMGVKQMRVEGDSEACGQSSEDAM